MMKILVLTLLAGTLLLVANDAKVLTNSDKRLNAKQDKRQMALNANLNKKELKWAKKEASREARLKARDKELQEKALKRALKR
ncbi:hypothetical protein [Sulfurimonas sp.]